MLTKGIVLGAILGLLVGFSGGYFLNLDAMRSPAPTQPGVSTEPSSDSLIISLMDRVAVDFSEKLVTQLPGEMGSRGITDTTNVPTNFNFGANSDRFFREALQNYYRNIPFNECLEVSANLRVSTQLFSNRGARFNDPNFRGVIVVTIRGTANFREIGPSCTTQWQRSGERVFSIFSAEIRNNRVIGRFTGDPSRLGFVRFSNSHFNFNDQILRLDESKCRHCRKENPLPLP